MYNESQRKIKSYLDDAQKRIEKQKVDNNDEFKSKKMKAFELSNKVAN